MKNKILSCLLALALVLPCMVVLSACKEKLKRIDNASISVAFSSQIETSFSNIKTTTSVKRKTEQELVEKELEPSCYEITNAHRYNKGSLQVRINMKTGHKVVKSNVEIVEKDNKPFDLSIEQLNDYSYCIVISMDSPAKTYNFTVNKLITTEQTATVNFGTIQVDESKLKENIVVAKGTTDDTGIDPNSSFDTTLYEKISNPNYDEAYAYDYTMLGIYNSMGNFVRLKALHEGKSTISRVSLNLVNPVIYVGFSNVYEKQDPQTGEMSGENVFPPSFLSVADNIRYTEEFLNTVFSFDFKDDLCFRFVGYADLPSENGKAYKFALETDSMEGFNGDGLNITFTPSTDSIK